MLAAYDATASDGGAQLNLLAAQAGTTWKTNEFNS
jgi:hypothetical protein